MGLIEVQARNMKFLVDDTLLYTASDEWIRVEGDIVRIGITDYAQKMLRDVIGVELPKPGTRAEKGKAVVAMESVKATAEVYMPITGVILDVNGRLKEEPELLNKDPYGGGWIITVKIEDRRELEQLLKPREYMDKIQKGK